MIGTTPTHTFKFPFDVSMIKELKITYRQEGKIVLEKYSNNFHLYDNTAEIKLTQEDTFLFKEGIVDIQLRALTNTGDAIKTEVYQIRADVCLDKEVLE